MRYYINQNIQQHIAQNKHEKESLQDCLQRLLGITAQKEIKQPDWRRMKVGTSCVITCTTKDEWYKFYGAYSKHKQRHTNKAFEDHYKCIDDEHHVMKLTRIA